MHIGADDTVCNSALKLARDPRRMGQVASTRDTDRPNIALPKPQTFNLRTAAARCLETQKLSSSAKYHLAVLATFCIDTLRTHVTRRPNLFELDHAPSPADCALIVRGT